jgi:hypothetical protein
MTQTTFTIIINGIKTATVNDVAGVVKQIDWTLKGELEGQTFDLPQTTDVPDPADAKFIPLTSLKQDTVISWIESHETRMDAIKAHIQYVLDKQVATAALTTADLPWAPAPTLVPEIMPAPAEIAPPMIAPPSTPTI